MGYHYTPISVCNLRVSNVDKDVQENELYYAAAENA